MPEVIKVLLAEHANVSQLLAVLDRQITMFIEGSDPDFEIMESVADYFQSFPDLYHYPKEDLIFQKLKKRNSAAAKAFGDLQSEHEEIAIFTREFAQAVQAGTDEPQVVRETYDHWLRGFVEVQRQHMGKEETLLYPAAVDSLTEEDWSDIDARITDAEDPLLGEAISERYEALRREILAWERETRED